MMIGLLGLVAALALGTGAYLQHPKFGALPEGDRLAAMQRSPNYSEGTFRNLVPTPILIDDQGTLSVLVGNLLRRVENLQPGVPLPTLKTDLKALDAGRDTVVWLGHSSFFALFSGKRLLIDPVFSPYAAPVSFSTQAFAGTTLYLPTKLSTQGAPAGIDPDVGDITYYAPWGNLAIFYRDFGHSTGLIRLGHFEDGMEALQVSGSMNVTIEPVGKLP